MKIPGLKNIVPVLLIVFVFAQDVLGQKVKLQKLTYYYMQYPAQPLDDNIESYLPKVTYNYEDLIAQQEAQYDADLKRAQDQYDRELDAYNKKTTLGKIVEQELLNQGKPVYVAPEKPFIAQRPNTSQFEDKYLNLEGYDKGNTNPVMITATIHEPVFGDPKMIKKSRSKTVDGQKVTEEYDAYTVEFTQKVHLYIESGVDGKIIYDQVVPRTEDPWTRTFNDSIPMDYKEKMSEQLLEKNMQHVQSLIADNYAKRKIHFSSEIAYGEGKYNNSDYKEALEYAMNGYHLLYNDRESGVKKLNAAIEIWLNALKEYNPKKRKARVNNKVGVATMMNIAEASIFTHDFNRAEQYLTKAKINDPKKGQLRRINYFIGFLRTYRERVEANL